MPELAHGEGEAEARVVRGLRFAVILSTLILVVESVGALFSRSLSLTVDAVHNVPDVVAFVASYSALAATARGATGDLTFGHHRLEVFAGFLNGTLVLGTGLVFGFAAVEALRSGGSFAGGVDPAWILFAAVPTLGLRAASFVVLGRVPRRVADLNLRSVLVHLGSDLLITGALLADGAVLLLRPGFATADSLAALAIAAILVYESLPVFRGTWEVLTEAVPRDLSLAQIESSLRSVPSVQGVHDIHVWAVCPTLVCMTAHIRVADQSVTAAMAVIHSLRTKMERDFGIMHAVFELEV